MTTQSHLSHWDGTAAEAIRLYEAAAPREHRDRVLHSTLRTGGRLAAPAGSGKANAAVDFAGAAERARAFASESDSGTVPVPPQDLFWGATFGVPRDASGVAREFHCEAKHGK
jgi:uncharacterized glyoxalase superfamily protein PhnB